MKYELGVCLHGRSVRDVARLIGIVGFMVVVCSATALDPKPIGELIKTGTRRSRSSWLVARIKLCRRFRCQSPVRRWLRNTVPQRLKPHRFLLVRGAAKAVPSRR